MFESLYFKDILDREVKQCVDDRYEGSGVNDRTLGQMYYLKQFSKYAGDMYDQLRNRIETKDAKNTTVVQHDKYFAATATTRNGTVKLDPQKIHDSLCSMLELMTDPETGTPYYTKVAAHMRATEIIHSCSTVGKPSTALSIVPQV